jgi:3-dehydroquinate synthase
MAYLSAYLSLFYTTATMQFAVPFPTATVDYHLESNFDELHRLAPPQNTIIITDEHVWELHQERFRDYRCLKVPAGEAHKTPETILDLARQLVSLEAHRKTSLVGVGGGMVCDITGFLASIYMRGLCFGFVPTTLLSMVDASIGGKNGVNLDVYKNMLGIIRQPKFILHDLSLLDTLPEAEWSNGFAEIIKYGCISDPRIIQTLSENNITFYKRRPEQLASLIEAAVNVKNKIVNADEQETGVRRLLNFGHTAGHAFEIRCKLSHGQAVALGMIVACMVSEQVCKLDPQETTRIISVLERYGLPTRLEFEPASIMEVLRMDKKRNTDDVDYVVIEKTGKACVKQLSFELIEQNLVRFAAADHH